MLLRLPLVWNDMHASSKLFRRSCKHTTYITLMFENIAEIIVRIPGLRTAIAEMAECTSQRSGTHIVNILADLKVID